MRLTKVELRRLFSRHLSSMALLGALIVSGLVLLSAFDQAKPMSDQALAFQRTQFEEVQKDWAANGAQRIRDCEQSQAQVRKQHPKTELHCNQLKPRWENWGKQKVEFSNLMRSSLLGWSYLMAFICLLLGASFVAAEFASGSMGNWLTFEPRRVRVYFSKLVAAGLGVIPGVLALLGLLFVSIWIMCIRYGSTSGISSKMWTDLTWMSIRSLTFAVVASVVGAAMGALLRSTAAVMGIALGYLVIIEVVFRRVLQGAQPWMLQLNMEGWLQHGTKYFINKCTTDNQGMYSCFGVEKALTFGHSSMYLGALVVLAVTLSAKVFQSRDVN